MASVTSNNCENLANDRRSEAMNSRSDFSDDDERPPDDDQCSLNEVSPRRHVCSRQCCSEIPWLTVSLLVMLHVLLGIQYYMFPILYDQLVSDLDASTAQVGWAASIQLCVSMLGGIFFSEPLRKFGNRRITIGGGLTLFLFMAISSFAPNIYTLYFTYGFAAGLGVSSLYLVVSVVSQQQFVKHRTFLTAIISSGYGLGQFICPALSYALLSSYSWRGAVFVGAAIMANVVPIGMLLPDRPKVIAVRQENNGTAGSTKTGLVSTIKESFNFSLLKQTPFLMYCILTLFVRIASIGCLFHVPNWLVANGVDKDQRTVLLTIQSAISTACRPLLGLLSENPRVDRLVLHGLGTVFATLAPLVLPLWTSPVGTIMALTMLSLHLVCWVPLVPVVLVDLMGVDNIGRSCAINFSFYGVACLVAPPFAGWIYDMTEDYDIPFYVNAGIGAVGVLGYIVMYIYLKRREPEKLESPIHQRNPKLALYAQTDFAGSSLSAFNSRNL